MEPEKQFFECACGCSVLSVTHDEWDETRDFVSLVLYGEYHHSWKDRMRHIWSIIKYGHPWGSRELLLFKNEASRLGRMLTEENVK